MSWTYSWRIWASTATPMVRDDLPALTRLLDEGRRRKEEVDGR